MKNRTLHCCLNTLAHGFLFFFQNKQKIMDENLDRVYGHQISEQRKKEIKFNSAKNIFWLIFNVIHYNFFFDSEPDPENNYRIPEIDESLKQNKGAIVLSTHNGTFFTDAAKLGRIYPVTIMVRYPKNKLIRKLLKRWFDRLGINVIDRVGGVNRALHALLDKTVLVFAMDQHAGKNGVWVDFFGESTSTFAYPAILALRLGSPVHFIVSHQLEGDEHYVWGSEAIPLIRTDDFEKDVVLNTARYAKLIEEVIRLEADTWIWMHKRWKPYNHVSDDIMQNLPTASKSRLKRISEKYNQAQQWNDEIQAVQNDGLFEKLKIWKIKL